MSAEHFDVLIIGAGISGVGAAAHLTTQHPGRSYAILEARAEIGGTWDLFRYPGIRSDSDLHTFGYEFRPWLEDRSIADGASIKHYVEDTARAFGVPAHIRFGHSVRRAEWSTEDERWTLTAEHDGQPVTFAATWLFCAGGYYRYDRGHRAELPGLERFEGRVVHPQFWPEDLDYAGKRVVVIGSGATAVTIVPAMAETAAHVTMLQRTPSYVVPVPAVDPLARALRTRVGAVRASRIAKRKNTFIGRHIFRASRRHPDRIRRLIRRLNVRSLPPGYDVDRHFNPPYNPWDQRMCLVPDGDLFRAIGAGQAAVVTDRISTFTADGIELESGAHLEADIVVTATGLELQALAGVDYVVDGKPLELPEHITYKGMMLTGVPNFVYAVGYPNASWTLKVDLVCAHFCRLLEHLDQRGATWCVPEDPPPGLPTRPLLDFNAGYVLRAIDRFPRQVLREPWAVSMDYRSDRKALLDGPVGDHMRFGGTRAGAGSAGRRPETAAY